MVKFITSRKLKELENSGYKFISNSDSEIIPYAKNGELNLLKN